MIIVLKKMIIAEVVMVRKHLKTTQGEIEIEVPEIEMVHLNLQLFLKRQKDVSAIEGKVLAMYARGMSQRDISKTIEDIYGFSVSHEMISDITDSILDELNEWRNRPLKKCYAFTFVDCMYVTLRNDYEVKECAVYVILGYDLQGHKEILGIWLSESESKNYWMQIFDDIKTRGVEDIFFISMDGVSGLEKLVLKPFSLMSWSNDASVHLIRNSIKYIPSKDYKKYTQSLKKVYGAPNLKAANIAFDSFKNEWSQYPGAVDVWVRNFAHIEQLYDYGSDVRKVMYTTNAIESINSSFRKALKKVHFLMKMPYLNFFIFALKNLKINGMAESFATGQWF